MIYIWSRQASGNNVETALKKAWKGHNRPKMTWTDNKKSWTVFSFGPYLREKKHRSSRNKIVRGEFNAWLKDDLRQDSIGTF